MNLELIFYTLAQRMATVTWTRSDGSTHQFVTIKRRLKTFSEVVTDSQPSCFQTEDGDNYAQVTGQPYKTTLSANWVIFQCIAKDPNALGTVENNLIVQACIDALAPLPADPGFSNNRCTLNGLVHHCFVSGKVFKDPGDLDGQGMLVIPIKLLVP